jgi:hypothetical protein
MIITQEGREDAQHSLAALARFGQIAEGFLHKAQIVEVCRHFGMVRAERRIVYSQRPLVALMRFFRSRISGDSGIARLF